MKKIISIALLLAMCLSLFAGCVENPSTESTGSDLANAKTYLFNMYNTAGKDEANKLTADKDVTSVVTIGGVTYPVEWSVEITSGPAEGVKISQSSTANNVKIDIMDQPEEEIYYTLTATIKDDKGNSESVSFKFYTPAVKKVEINTNDKVVIYNPGDGKYATGTDYLYTSSSGSQKHELELTEDKSAALALTVQQNDNGTVTFVTDDGKYLFADGTHVQLVNEKSDYTEFVLEAAEGGQYIKCAHATFNDKPQYLEVYSGYLTCYGMGTNTALYIFELQTAGDSSANNSAILDAAYELGSGESLVGTYTLTGKITKINTPWDDGFQNITVTIVCDGDTARPVQCYRLKGNGAKELAVGDTITVTGAIKNYNGTVEFDAGCNLDKVVKADGSGNENPSVTPDPKPSTPADPEPSTPATPSSPLNGVGKPAAGTGYKFAIYQASMKKALYFKGEMDGYYLATSENAADAVEVFVENVSGGLRMYFMSGNTKKYIDIVPRDNDPTKVNVVITETPTAVYTYSETLKVLVAHVADKDWYLGTYGTYKTFSPSETYRIEDPAVVGVSQFIGEFVK